MNKDDWALLIRMLLVLVAGFFLGESLVKNKISRSCVETGYIEIKGKGYYCNERYGEMLKQQEKTNE